MGILNEEWQGFWWDCYIDFILGFLKRGEEKQVKQVGLYCGRFCMLDI